LTPRRRLAKYGNTGRLLENPHLAAAEIDIAVLRAAIMEALGRGQKRSCCHSETKIFVSE